MSASSRGASGENASAESGILLRVVTFVAARHRDSLLPALRTSTAAASELLWCVAFVRSAGVHMLAKELRQVPGRKRLLATGAFGGVGSDAALAHAHELGLEVRVLNLGGGTYHPKIYLFDGTERQAFVGSANLTGGLISNVEGAVRLDSGSPEALADVWELGEELWEHPNGSAWAPAAQTHATESMSEQLFQALLLTIPEGSVVETLADHRSNHVAVLSPDAIWVETEKTRALGTGAQPVPGWMLQLAYDRLRSHGTLTNADLLNQLRVHRSSFVCAALAELPDVAVLRRSPITLGWRRM